MKWLCALLAMLMFSPLQVVAKENKQPTKSGSAKSKKIGSKHEIDAQSEKPWKDGRREHKCYGNRAPNTIIGHPGTSSK